MSSSNPRKFVFIEGEKAVIKYYVFGINLESGMKIVPLDTSKKSIVAVSMALRNSFIWPSQYIGRQAGMRDGYHNNMCILPQCIALRHQA